MKDEALSLQVNPEQDQSLTLTLALAPTALAPTLALAPALSLQVNPEEDLGYWLSSEEMPKGKCARLVKR